MKNNKKVLLYRRILPIICICALFCSLTSFKTDAYRIRVRIRIRFRKKVYLDSKSLSIHKGDTEWLQLKNASNNVKWSSTRPSVATVKKDKDGNWGLIYAKKKGTAVIKARYKGHTYRCKVRVKKKKKVALEALDDEVKIVLWDDEGLSESEEEIEFYSSLNNINLYYKVKDPEYIKCKWGKWDDDYIKLYVRPKVRKAGTTSITITNTYNKKKIVIPVTICNEGEL